MLRGALEIANAIRLGDISATEIAAAALARIAQHDRLTNAFTQVTGDRALQEGAAIDALRASGVELPPLAGVPYAVKNLFDIESVTTIAGSRVLESEPPASEDAFLITRMKANGAVLVGALNMDEFAYGFTTENHHAGPCRNPRDLARTAGGSSGGSAASVAAGYVPIALGTDTNGSIRVPASFCGVFGIKPTYGRLSRRGAYPFVASLDHMGAFARSVSDLAAAYNALQFPDVRDPASAKRPTELVDFQSHEGTIRVARLGGYFEQNACDDVVAASSLACEAIGGKDVVEFEDAEVARCAAFVISAAEGGALHLQGLRSSYDHREPLSRDRLVAGALVPASWVAQAQRIRAVLIRRFLELFNKYDVLVAPAAPTVAPLLGQEHFILNGRELPMRAALGLLSQPISFLGLPVVAVPLNAADELPTGIQVIAPPWREELAFKAARRLEQCGLARSSPAFV
ncbi:AtzE family amidohydrolase [Caballeronia sp. LjRoot34]|uniref:AtzE family amidohydrolase n=1 Tax=Caballeronia sp. LjRoot34 TaxID=3342325 RepID=UPI003ED0049D